MFDEFITMLNFLKQYDGSISSKYIVSKDDYDSYYDVLVEDVDECNLIIQFSVSKEDGVIWDINISTIEDFIKFAKYLEGGWN